ncbi:MAG: aminotransferase class V-fold PLP-dependent enzyme [Verrucomicrobia bacterium]|nr:aminotransferase class V-fold PLP-dependent enzyme [Verrucomicrobiota bacterium]
MHGYFDYNATTPLSAAATEAWNTASRIHWHNASSLYREAAVVHQLLDDMRSDLADLVDCDEPDRILFNSGATEANNAVLSHIARTTAGKVAISAIEHPCVSDCARALLGDRLVELPVNGRGVLELDALAEFLSDQSDIALVSVMAANNECGTLQPWQQALKLCREREVPFHCDAAQWIGKLPALGLGDCDYLTGSAHKFGGPKGTGFLILPEDEMGFRSLIGGPQQEERRAGTENYPAVAAMLAAWKVLEPRLDALAQERVQLRAWAEAALTSVVPGIRIVGIGADRLWNTILCILPAHDNRRWLTRLNRLGFCVSTGSACSSGKENPSRVLQAMDYTYEDMGRTLRISSGWETSKTDWEVLVKAMAEVSTELGG